MLETHFADFDFANNPAVDFARTVERVPALVLRPRSVSELVACMGRLAEERLPYTLRGGGHSSGGQTLTRSVVVETRRLDRILEITADSIRVEGGAQWLTVVERLLLEKRRPLVVTDNPRVTVGGSLAVGGFGYATHLHGPIVATVDALTLVTPDAATHKLTPRDELFHLALAGAGQLGAIVDATVRTTPPTERSLEHLHSRVLRWRTLAGFIEGAIAIASARRHEFLRARLYWGQPFAVEAIVGDFGAPSAGDDVSRAEGASPIETFDLAAEWRRDPTPLWNYYAPVMEVILPIPEAGARDAAWRSLDEVVRMTGLARDIAHGASVALVPRQLGLPLAPIPKATPWSLVVALRPRVLAWSRLASVRRALREVGTRAIANGGRVYLIGEELGLPGFLDAQFGVALAPLVAARRRVDPFGLCNPGLLPT